VLAYPRPMPAVAVSKAEGFAQELAYCLEGPPSTFRLHQIARDCELAVSKVGPNDKQAALHQVAGVARAYMGQFKEALAHFNAATAINVRFPGVHHNAAFVLGRLGRDQDALDRLVKGIDIEGADVPQLTLLAEVLARLGQRGDAVAALEDAAEKAKSWLDHFTVAEGSADLELHVDACEMFARALSIRLRKPLGNARAIDFIRAAPEELKGCLRYPGSKALQGSVELMDAHGDELLAHHGVLGRLPDGKPPTEAIEEAREVFEAMAPFRARATRAALGAGGDGQI
jgi:tetratricopeptide (TPR) repeat protein